MTDSLDVFTAECLSHFENTAAKYLFNPAYPSLALQNAGAYAVQNGGKRIRPILVYATGRTFDTDWARLSAPACAIELIHAYSLIHDDLPAMDNSDLRRGKPACHKAFGEALAVLAGDALQPLAFQIIATDTCDLSSEQRVKMIAILSEAAGIEGMAGGQALDLAGVQSIEQLNNMYALKTGALLIASIQLGLTASNINDATIVNALETYIKNIGLAFQIQDDLLDIKGNSVITGKPQGIDAQNNKVTYISLYGVDKSESIVQELFSSALHALDILGNNAEILRKLAYYLLQRNK